MSEILNFSLVNTAPSPSFNEHKKTRMLFNLETCGDVNHGEPFHHLVVLLLRYGMVGELPGLTGGLDLLSTWSTKPHATR